ncbi:S8 family peptidase [Kribbella catacumbae]|uniref:S8 family peptidase n=1 Tax=Kribbella catacumbae TaxID=460086 RepID=UPI000372F546|nr:S8 family serine peptidase [Kribbella catacumbae]
MNPRWKSLLLSAAVMLGAAASPAGAAAPSPGRPPGKTPPTASKATITLLTGDRVVVTSRPGQRDRVDFLPSPGSRSASAVISYSGGHTIAVPSTVAGDVRSGRLDRSLFDLTTLLAEGRDDAHSKGLPVIVEYAGTPKSATAVAARAALRGTTKTRVLTSIGARAAVVDKTKASDFWESVTPQGERVAESIRRVTLDRRVQASSDLSVPQIGAPAAWQRGFTGKGVKIAVLDTGIDASHPDLKGRLAASQNFTDAPDSSDHVGHGTHVAGIAAGDGAASGGKYKGVAPEATLLNGKVLADDGGGTTSGIIAGMEWAVQQGAAVVNMSLGGAPSDGTDELSTALNRLSRSSGTLFVVAAGNCRMPAPAQVTTPAAADDAIAVGNLTRNGSLNASSCRGPRAGNGALKPEISAPGTDIVAARAAGTDLGDPVGDHYTTLTGTSMATPHVAGVAALIAQAHPDWKTAQLRARLMSTADPQGARVHEEGAGRVDADQATAGDVTVDTGELELGMLTWPYPAKDTVTRQLTYNNPTTTTITLQLAAAMDPAAAAPKLSATGLVVPANGEASVTVTVDRAAAGSGTFSGRITATAAGADPMVTTFGWYAEPERHELTVHGIAKDGQPANAELNLARVDGPPPQVLPGELFLRNGTAKLRLPPGRYVVTSPFLQDATDTAIGGFTLLSSGEIDLSEPVTATLDARKAEPVEQSVQGRLDLMPRGREVAYLIKKTDGVPTGGVEVILNGNPQLATAVQGGVVSTGRSEFAMASRLEIPPYRARTVGGPELEVRDLFGGPRFTGTRRLVPVDAGTAQPGELTGVRGKLALIAWADSDDRPVGDLVKAAQDAGAAGAMLYNPDRPGVEGMSGFWAYIGAEKVVIPTMRISRATAHALASRPKPVEIVGLAVTPYVYDLMEATQGQIPAKTQVTVTPSQLATVRESFGANVSGTETSEVRVGTAPGGTQFGRYNLSAFPVPSRRTSYVQANSIAWHSELFYNNATGPVANAHSVLRSYHPGEQVNQRWMAPVLVSGLPDGRSEWGGVEWIDDFFVFQVSPFVRQQEFAGPVGNVDSELVLERNGQQVGSTADTSLWIADLPDDAAQFRATLTTRRDLDFWKYSNRVQSTWTWTSKGGRTEVMPIITADLDLPDADALGRVRAGQAVPLTFGLRHQIGATASQFTSADLKMSYDGSNWTKVPLTGSGDGTYTASITHPAAAAGQAPSLRLVAVDADGNKLEQEVTRAYGLR